MQTPIRIGLVLHHSYSFYRSVALGIRTYAETRPHWLFTSVFPDEQPLRSLGELKPDGLIAAINTEALAKALRSWNRPFVNITAILSKPPLPRIGCDNLAVGRLAAEHLLQRGLWHFGYVGTPNWNLSIDREAGFRKAIEEAGYQVTSYSDPEGRTFDPSLLDPTARQWRLNQYTQRWLQSLPKPVGVFAANDLLGLQLTETCRHCNLRVPEDVALIGADNDDLHCELARPTLSSIAMAAEKIGYESAALLDRSLSGAKPPREPILLPPQGVVARRSSDMLAIDDPEVVAAARFIREHGHLPLCVADVLKEVSVGRRSLERRFHAAFGRGLWEEIRRVHVERAKRLLADTVLPIKAVAEQSGFTDFRHLAVVFRKELDVSPTDYRHRMRGLGYRLSGQ